MTRTTLITRYGDQPIMAPDVFESAVDARWPGATIYSDGINLLSAKISPPRPQSSFMVHLTRDRVSPDATPEQDAVAAWAAATIDPDPAHPLLMIDGNNDLIRTLPVGITPDQVWDRDAWTDPSDYRP